MATGIVAWGVWTIRQKTLSWHPADGWVVAYLVWMVVNRWLTDAGAASFIPLLTAGGMGLLYFAARQSNVSHSLYCVLVATGVIQAAWGVLQYAGIARAGHAYFPMTGAFGNPGLLGGFLALAFVAAAGGWLAHKNTKRIFWGIACIATGVAMGLADSRAAWVAAVAGLLVLLIKKSPRRVPLWGKALAVGTAGILAAGLYIYRPTSAEGRLFVWKIALSAWTENPLTGYGPGGFASHYMFQQADYLDACADEEERLGADDNYLAFNEPLRILYEEGAVGFALFAALCVQVFRAFRRGRSPCGRTGCALLVTLGAFSCFSYPLHHPGFQVTLALLMAVAVNESDATRQYSSVPAFRAILPLLAILYACLALPLHSTAARAEQALKDKDFNLLATCAPRLHAYPNFTGRYGCLLFQEKRLEEAERWLNQAVRLRPLTTYLWRRGVCLLAQGDPQGALACYTLAERMVPGLMRPAYLRFDCYRKRGMTREALALGKELLHRPVKLVNSETLRMKADVARYIAQTTASPKTGKGGGP